MITYPANTEDEITPDCAPPSPFILASAVTQPIKGFTRNVDAPRPDVVADSAQQQGIDEHGSAPARRQDSKDAEIEERRGSIHSFDSVGDEVVGVLAYIGMGSVLAALAER